MYYQLVQKQMMSSALREARLFRVQGVFDPADKKWRPLRASPWLSCEAQTRTK